jgi:hypothetical protein
MTMYAFHEDLAGHLEGHFANDILTDCSADQRHPFILSDLLTLLQLYAKYETFDAYSLGALLARTRPRSPSVLGLSKLSNPCYTAPVQ